MSHPSQLAEIADRLLQQKHDITLEQWIRERRDIRRHYHEIATALREETDGLVDVTPESVRRWDLHYQKAIA